VKLPGLLIVALLSPAPGCQARRSEPDPTTCIPSTSQLPTTSSAEELAGAYRLRLVATKGPMSGRTALGALTLQPYDSALRTLTIAGLRDTAASYVLYGSTDIALDSVGAVSAGKLDSEDPLRPGVVAVERKGALTLRLGSEANRRDVTRFDGGFTALRVLEATGNGFAGSWTSGLRLERSGGHFCAERMAEGR
jgi:hypothetical protein